MATVGKSLWQKLASTLADNPEDKTTGKNLFREFTQHGYIQLTPAQSVMVSPGAVLDFFRRLSLIRSSSSPVGRRRDDRWLHTSDFQILDAQKYGTFFRMFLDIPRMRTDSIIFLPVTESDPGRNLSPKSHSHIDNRFIDPLLESCGINLEDQFRLLLSAVHLCGKKTGYYLSPLIDPVSAVIYRKPEFFQWLSDSEARDEKGLLVERVRDIVKTEYSKTGIFDYLLLKRQIEEAGLRVPVDKDGSVCFDFQDDGALDYFSMIFSGLQSQYPLDFAYLAAPVDFTDGNVELLYSAPRLRGGGKRYTGWILELSRDQSLPSEPNEPVVHIRKNTESSIIDEQFIHSWFHSLGTLSEKNKNRRVPVTEAVSLSSSGASSSGILPRQLFLSRFSGIAMFRRPLILREDMTEIQNRMEDIYQRYRGVLEKGSLLRVVADETFAWWIIREKGRLLIPLMALDTPDEKKPEPVKIDYSLITGRNRILSVIDYDFTSAQGSLFLSADHSLMVKDLKPGSFRLFSLQ